MSATANTEEVGHVTVAAGAILGRLDRIAQLLRDILLDSEQEPDYDQSWVVVGNPAAAAISKISLPRTIKHAEVTIQAQFTPVVACAVFAGNLSVADAAAQFSTASGTLSNSAAISASIGSSVTARDYLDGSGILTVYVSAAAVGACLIRVRSLDESQPRPQRT